MSKTELWRGVYPALLTPFTAEGTIDYDMFKRNFLAQIDAGVAGLIIAGSLGEVSTLSTQEDHDLLVFAKDHMPDHVPVILNIAYQTTADAVHAAQETERLGADGLMLRHRMHYKTSDREVVEYSK